MCGIAGIINLNNTLPPSPEVAEAMTGTLVHRGPDGFGYFSDDQIAFGHRRLKIIDLSDRAKQPMQDESGKYCITFNGEIYNYREIRNELGQKGHRFFSASDTEVLLKAWIEYGPSCLDKCIGMFAFALYDKTNNKTYLIRDRIGVKPLFYSFTDGRILFASEIKAILKYPGFRPRLNKNAVSSYLSYRYPVGGQTMFDNIHSLLPGHLIEVSAGKAAVKKWYDLPVITEKQDRGEKYYIEKTRELLSSSVAYRMISDVPIGAYLSGGLDSSIVTALMAGKSREPVKTFTIGFDEEGYNEFSYARQVADRWQTEHHEINLSASRYIEEMQKLIGYKDAPLGVANEPALHVMSAELKKHITVVLSGEGADEIFGGYGRIFRSPYDYERMQYSGNETLEANLRTKYKGAQFGTEVEHFLSQYRYVKTEDMQRMLDPDFTDSLQGDAVNTSWFESLFGRLDGMNLYDKYMWVFEKTHIVGLLERVDMTTMATAVEARVPFVDHRLVEFAMTIPVEYKLKWKSEADRAASALLNSDQISEKHDMPKYLLKKSFENDLPKDVVWRKKMGFPVPLHRWFGKEFNDFAKELLLDDTARSRQIYNVTFLKEALSSSALFTEHSFGLKIWMLVNLELWFRKYLNG